ncbi:unnamed protein product [Allacma fusca]|uniref:Peptidase S1 domain-containing protein n=1 Tax=Allacma fusca TaxID=39272 RepID=A0A8J2KJL9_9HEXA|nr:unnamed protein product [Allacma fusca]
MPYQFVGKEELGKVIASGWGKTAYAPFAKTLQTVVLDIISNADCKKLNDELIKTHVCTKTRNRNVCKGDSGGGIDKVSNGLSYAFGVSSFGANFCTGYSVFTRVSEYLTWIEEQTGETFCKP